MIDLLLFQIIAIFIVFLIYLTGLYNVSIIVIRTFFSTLFSDTVLRHMV